MRKSILLMILLFFVIMLTACKHVEDTNGTDDYTIQTYTDADILSNHNKYVVVGMVQTSLRNQGKFNASKLSGVCKIDQVNAKNETITFDLDVKCENDNMKVVLIHGDKIIKDFKINSQETYTIENANGKYILKVVGESAKFKINYVIS